MQRKVATKPKTTKTSQPKKSEITTAVKFKLPDEKKSKLLNDQRAEIEKKSSSNVKTSTVNTGKSINSREKKTTTDPKPSNVDRKKNTSTKPIPSQSKSQSSHPKPLKATSQNVIKKNAPLKASHSIIATSNETIKISSKNVMNQVHNVTISSPPSERREIPLGNSIEYAGQRPDGQRIQNGARERTRTRTLGEDEIILMRPGATSAMLEAPMPVTVAEPKTEQSPATIQAAHRPQATAPVPPPTPLQPPKEANELRANKTEIKPSVSFDILLANAAETAQAHTNTIETEPSDDEYEDDFESYESDFESDVSSEPSTDDTISTGDSSSDDNIVSTSSKHPFDTGAESFENADLESGSFELKILSSQMQRTGGSESNHTHQHDSFQLNGMQLDSGIEMPTNTSGVNTSLQSQNSQIDSLESSLHHTKDDCNKSKADVEATSSKVIKPTFSKRGNELLRKITLDDMSYVLFDFRPIPYELFMKIYGNSDTVQVAVQTHNNRIDQESQCDLVGQQTRWTQYPIAYDACHINDRNYADYKFGCGIDTSMVDTANSNLNQMLDNCLQMIQNASSVSNNNPTKYPNDNATDTIPHINYVKLNRFLMESELTLSHITNTSANCNLEKSSLPFCDSFFTLNVNTRYAIFETMQLQRLFVHSSMSGFLFTLHVDETSDLNIIAIWDLIATELPICLLSVWSLVHCVEIHPRLRNIIFAGLDDGTIAIWDISEDKSRHPNFRKDIKRLVPSQITSIFFENALTEDLGRCMDIRSLISPIDVDCLDKYNSTQLCSLHECGLLVLWSVLNKSAGENSMYSRKRIEHQSTWSTIQLAQTKVLDLRPVFGHSLKAMATRPTSSTFDKTRSYFENDLYNDLALQQLQQLHVDNVKLLTSFRCTALELSNSGILITTNENFVLFVRKSFKDSSVQCIQIDVNASARIECTLPLPNTDGDIILVALTNGKIKALCCNQHIDQLDETFGNVDLDDGSTSSISSLPPNSLGQHPANSDISIPSTSIADPNLLTNKSCTIQSLVQGERKIYDEMYATNRLDNSEYKFETAFGGDERETNENDSNKSSNLSNGQLVSGNPLGIFKVAAEYPSLSMLSTRQCIALHKNRLRTFNLLSNDIGEIAQNTFTSVVVTQAIGNKKYLILLDTDGMVEVHRTCTTK